VGVFGGVAFSEGSRPPLYIDILNRDSVYIGRFIEKEVRRKSTGKAKDGEAHNIRKSKS